MGAKAEDRYGADADMMVEILRGAIQRVGRGWKRGELAANRDGEPVSANSPSAVAWTAEGAIWASDFGTNPCSDVVRFVATVLGLPGGTGNSHHDNPSWSISEWNDALGRTRQDVLDGLGLACALARCQAEVETARE